MHIHGLLAWLAFTSLPLAAQNWVTNGDFSNGLTGWTQTGFSYNPALETWDTTGIGASPCFACSPGGQMAPPPYPANTLDQTVLIAPSLVYELSADVTASVVQANAPANDQLSVTAEIGGVQVAQTILSGATQPLPKEWRFRLSGRVTLTIGGQVPLSLKFSRVQLASATSPRVRIDNISLQITSGPTFNFEGPRRIARVQTTQTTGAPNATYAVFAAALALPSGLSLPGFQGLWYLDPASSIVLLQGTLDAIGRRSIQVPVPNDPMLTLAPVFFQPAQLLGTSVHLGIHHGVVFTQ